MLRREYMKTTDDHRPILNYCKSHRIKIHYLLVTCRIMMCFILNGELWENNLKHVNRMMAHWQHLVKQTEKMKEVSLQALYCLGYEAYYYQITLRDWPFTLRLHLLQVFTIGTTYDIHTTMQNAGMPPHHYIQTPERTPKKPEFNKKIENDWTI